MLVSDGWTGLFLCFGLAVLRPCLAVHTAASVAAERRWLAYFLCLCVFVLPLFCLPAWTPLRYDAMAGGMLLLGWNDAQTALCVYEERVRPAVARALRVAAQKTWEGERGDDLASNDAYDSSEADDDDVAASRAAASSAAASSAASDAAAAGSDATDVTLVGDAMTEETTED